MDIFQEYLVTLEGYGWNKLCGQILQRRTRKLPAGYSGGFTVNRNKLLPLRKVLSLIKVEFLGIQKARIS